ncbi:MAG: hypothetical protein PSY14_05220 [bacterium]|nr:hypothetical protein [bacterium]
MDKLKFGFFEDFADPTFLPLGEGDDFLHLKDALSQVLSGTSVELEKDNRFQSTNDTRVQIFLGDKPSGMRKVDKDNAYFEWRLTKIEIEDFLEKIVVVLASDQACHHYLDADEDAVAVVISNGEYPKNFG